MVKCKTTSLWARKATLTEEQKTYYEFADAVLAEAQAILKSHGIIGKLTLLSTTTVKRQETDTELYDLLVEFSLCDEPICYGGSAMHFGKMSMDTLTEEYKKKMVTGIVKSIEYWVRSRKRIHKELDIDADGNLHWLFI